MPDLAVANISILSMVGNAPAVGAMRQRNIDSGCNFSEILSSQQPKAEVNLRQEKLHDSFLPRTQTSQNSDRPDYTADQRMNIVKPREEESYDNSQEEFADPLSTAISSNDDQADMEETDQPEVIATVIPLTNILAAPESYSEISNIDTALLIQAEVSPEEADAQPQVNLGEDLDRDYALQNTPVETTRAQDKTTQERIITPAIASQAGMEGVTPSNNLELAQDKLASHNAAQTPSQNKISAELTNIVKSVEVRSAHEIAPIANSNLDQGKNFEQNLSGENDAYKLPDGLTENVEMLFEGIEDNIQLKTTSTSATSITNRSENLQSKDSSNLLSQISDSIADAALDTKYLNDKRVVTIILQPESLGSIEARIERGIAGQLKITLTVENKETFDIINSTKLELMEAVTKVTGAEDTTFRFDLKEGNHGNGGYEENHNRFAFNEESQNTDADNRHILAKNPLPYNNLPHYNEGVSLLI